ncbi:MAG TPA: TRAP transporter large permease subunit [Gammaproteobacteria bacterium]|nr:TRAP transporter large permease subunit [Gammaproteobacteria bacterium]
MTPGIMTLLFFGSLLFFVFLGAPLAFVLGGVSAIFLYFTWGMDGFFMVSGRIWTTMNSFTLVAIPLFVLMALILAQTSVSQALYRMMHLWMGGLRGGLAIGTVVICTMFGAMVGVSAAAVVAMGTVALPAMLERNYDKEMVLGAINAGGGFGILLPPSVAMIIFCLSTGVSVGSLFAAGVLPGLLLAVLVSLYIGIRCYFQPEMGPALPKEERGTWREKLAAVRAVLLPIVVVVMVLGSILSGIATPTEGAAVGVLGALFCAFVSRDLSWKMIAEAGQETLRISGMIMWIFMASHAFSTAYNAMGAQDMIMGLVNYIPGGEWGALAAMLGLIFFLGMVLDPIGIMLITLPIFMPIVDMHGIDPIWFGVMFIIMIEIGYMTPPFGFNLFYLKGVAPAGITMGDIYRSAIPYVGVILLGLLIVAMFPAIALWLPGQLF